jgi:ribosomal protein S18 acetylase RimI-like enzyme
MKDIIIHQVQISDETERQAIIELLWMLNRYENTLVEDLRLDRAAAEQTLLHDIQVVTDSGGALLCAAHAQRMVGFLCLVFQSNSPFVALSRLGHINDLIVADAYRGLGVGHRLVAEAEALSHKEGLEALSVSTPYRNTPALQFYERLGLNLERSDYKNGYPNLAYTNPRQHNRASFHNGRLLALSDFTM